MHMGDVRRVSRNGKFLGWYIRYKDVDGKRKQRASHQPSRALAARLLLEIEARVARGLVGIPEPAQDALKLSALVARFLDEYSSPRLKSLSNYRRQATWSLQRILAELDDKPLDQIVKRDIERARNALSLRYRPNTVRSSVRFLSTAMSWAVREGLLEASPLKGVELPAAERSFEYLSAAEVAALLALLDERVLHSTTPRLAVVRLGVVLAVRLGLRRGEIFGLRWQDIAPDLSRLTVARSYRLAPKSGQSRHLPLPTEVSGLLRAWQLECPTTAEGLVCPVLFGGQWQMPTDRGDKGLNRLFRKAGIRPKQRPWHSLRHTFASHYMMQGGNILALQRILGHSDIKQTMVYSHLSPDYLAKEMERVRYQ